MTIIVQMAPGSFEPRPLASYCELWRRTIETLNEWAVRGYIPVAFKHPNGEWWVQPLELLQWHPGRIEHETTTKRNRNRRESRQVMEGPKDRERRAPLRHPAQNES